MRSWTPGVPTAPNRVPRFESELGSVSNFLLMYTLGGAGDSSGPQVCAAHRGLPDGVPNSWLPASDLAPAGAGIWRVCPQNEDICLSLHLSLSLFSNEMKVNTIKEEGGNFVKANYQPSLVPDQKEGWRTGGQRAEAP